ncbi:NUDIX domain-containing protein [Actinoplanes sp. NPDC051346]|uniref:NUDIX domain-containing protein n=1 Tax=Actinoplanes sp. NPDC051346 TaxID=3155048 RepID=UPI003433219B
MNIAEAGTAVDIVTPDQHWQSTWHSPTDVPAGTAHGSAGVCLTDGQVVLVTDDGRHWQLPGGRPEDGEDWADTLDREVQEEACADRSPPPLTRLQPWRMPARHGGGPRTSSLRHPWTVSFPLQ